MINSILLLGSTYKKDKKINILCMISWIVFMLLGANLKTGIIFAIINIISFGIVLAIMKLFKGKYSNKIVSILSILIWSIIIDIICCFVYPQFMMGQSMIAYISNGLLFNYKYVGYNLLLVLGIEFVKYLSKLKINIKSKRSIINILVNNTQS